MKKENWVEAGKFFEHVRTKYPFSKYAALSELRLADSKYLQSRFPEAAEAYTAFVTAHPTHEEADYAAYRAALSRYQDAPADFVLFPPAYEKDQKALRVGGRAAGGLPQGPPQRQAGRPRPRSCWTRRRRQAGGPRGLRRRRSTGSGSTGPGRPCATRGWSRDYPGAPQEPEALLRMGQAYAQLDEKFRAQQALQRLLARYPKDPRRAEAEKLLGQLR